MNESNSTNFSIMKRPKLLLEYLGNKMWPSAIQIKRNNTTLIFFLRLKNREFFELKNKNKVFILFLSLPPISNTHNTGVYKCFPLWRPLTYHSGKNKDGEKWVELKHIKGGKSIRTWWQFIGYNREGSAKDNSKKVFLASLRQESQRGSCLFSLAFWLGTSRENH